MSPILEQLFTLLNSDLYLTCPVLSGNMRANIQITHIAEKEVQIVINAPFYDPVWFSEHGIIEYTYQNYNGITDYAMWVNDEGAFRGKSTRSKHWCNRCIYDVVTQIASKFNADVVNELNIS